MCPRPIRLLITCLALSTCAQPVRLGPGHTDTRAQRSANLSHITGTSRHVQLFLKNRYLQLLPDGTVNGTTDGSSIHTVLQRATYKVGLLTIQGVSTCLYLCMDACGFQYAHKDLSDDCMFEEHIEQNNYNTYSRVRAGKKTFVALDTRGRARRTQVPAGRPLGNLAGYALTLTRRREQTAQQTCPARRHRARLKRPPPFHRNCQRRVQKQNSKNKQRKHPHRRHRQPRIRKRQDYSTTETWDDTTDATTEIEFFRPPSAQ